MTIQMTTIPTTALVITKIQEMIKTMIQTHMTVIPTTARYNEDPRDDKAMIQTHMTAIPTIPPGPECQSTLTSHPFSINTDMMRPVVY